VIPFIKIIFNNYYTIRQVYFSPQLKLLVRYHTTEGNGIGLALCKKIADRHNIKSDVKSAQQSGAIFTFILPIQ
jgi:signal transduction histidine kinase